MTKEKLIKIMTEELQQHYSDFDDRKINMVDVIEYFAEAIVNDSTDWKKIIKGNHSFGREDK